MVQPGTGSHQTEERAGKKEKKAKPVGNQKY
jgi:hypothetical protein